LILRSLFPVRVLSLAITLLVTACSTVPTAEIGQAQRVLLYEAKSGALEESGGWALKGRLAVNDGEDGGSGHLNWQKHGQSSSMNFHGALGRGAWQLNADENGAVLEWADGKVHRADSVGELVEQQLGWTIPVDALAWWVRGLTAPGDWDLRLLDEYGNIEKLSQLGWNIEYKRYRDAGNISMPVKLTARRQSYTVKVAIQAWDLGAGTGRDE
jgi:outer membrane lipoprotein LolB